MDVNFCILVYDDSLKDSHSDFYTRLNSEGFTPKRTGGLVFRGQPWVFVKLGSMTYVPGILGIPMGDPIGNHAVTINEFWTLYYMFKSVFDKYKGLNVFEFPKNDTDKQLENDNWKSSTNAETIKFKLMKDKVEIMLSSLSNREREVLELRFGFKDGIQRSLEEVGRYYGVTSARIRQIEAKALRRLRELGYDGEWLLDGGTD